MCRTLNLQTYPGGTPVLSDNRETKILIKALSEKRIISFIVFMHSLLQERSLACSNHLMLATFRYSVHFWVMAGMCCWDAKILTLYQTTLSCILVTKHPYPIPDSLLLCFPEVNLSSYL